MKYKAKQKVRFIPDPYKDYYWESGSPPEESYGIVIRDEGEWVYVYVMDGGDYHEDFEDYEYEFHIDDIYSATIPNSEEENEQ